MNSLLLSIFVLVTALSLDAFAAGFIYGTDHVRIPAVSAAIITGLSSGILALFLLLGDWFGLLVPERLTSILCFIILFLLGCIRLFDSTLKSLIRRFAGHTHKIRFSRSHATFLLTIYADPAAANETDISVLSPSEAFSLGLALSLDSAAAGFGAGMTPSHLPAALFFSLFLTAAALTGGSLLGRTLTKHAFPDLSWLSGILLISLAFFKLTAAL